MEILNAQGRLGSDFTSYVLNSLAASSDQPGEADVLVIVPDSEAAKQFLRAARSAHSRDGQLQVPRVTTLAIIARTLLKQSDSVPRIVTQGEIEFIPTQCARSRTESDDIEKKIETLSTRLSEYIPGQHAFNEEATECLGYLRKFWKKHDLASWDMLPGLSLHRFDWVKLAENALGADEVFLLNAQDLSPAEIFLAAALARKRLVICSASEVSCGPGALLRQGTQPLHFAEKAIAEQRRNYNLEEESMGPAALMPESARVVWDTLDEELSGLAAYIWKLLRENPGLEARDICVVAPNDQWARALQESLASDHLDAELLPKRSPLALPLSAPKACDEHRALLRLRLAAYPDDELSSLELGSMGYAEKDAPIIENLAQLSGFSIAKFACRGLKAPFVEAILAERSWQNVEEALENTLERIVDPSFEARPHDVLICTPEHTRSLRFKVLIAAGLAEELWPFSQDASIMHGMLRAAFAADVVVLSRPRTIGEEAARRWRLESGRTVSWSSGPSIVLHPSPAFAEERLKPGAPLSGEQLLSGRL